MSYEDLCGCGGACNPGNNPDSNVDPDFPFTCEDKPFPFSAEELDIFDNLMTIKKEVRDLQKRLGELDGMCGQGNGDAARLLQEKLSCNDRIDALRREWAEWKRKGEQAAIRRMIALGHIDADI